MNEPIKHHFVPQFYLSYWCNNDGNIPVFMRNNCGKIHQYQVAPRATAFEKHLYSYEKVPDHQRQAVENFLAEVDDKAAPIMTKLIAGGLADLLTEDRIYWTRYLIAAGLRIPEIVHDLRECASKELRRSLTEDHDEEGDIDELTQLTWTEKTFVGLTDNFGMMILPDIITDPKHTRTITEMRWWVEDLSRANVQLLTSDRPLLVSTRLERPNCLLTLPLSPTCVFFASQNRDLQTALTYNGENHLVRRCNRSIVSQAVRFVYGVARTTFVDRRLRYLPS